MLAALTIALSFSPGRQPSAALHRLRGGSLPSVDQAKQTIAYLGIASGLAGFMFPQVPAV